ncbi:hypothetical protein [Conexibacter arvalis]|uniref:Fibronectin type-III domain-containing protein n=1 Tax=Conexibacter arvalis TaxID=912552 RepID=A0A840IE83_9ACTN|nr:hypothetical protein [Conexibacter arvalis]MBB4662645.1 hypothetical protein [Conexibacter arvalis]
MQRRVAHVAVAAVAATAAFATAAQAASPTVTTRTAGTVRQTAATLRGTVNPHGTPTTYSFQWGTSATYGQQTPNRSAGRGTGGRDVSVRVGGLAPGTVYHYRIVATNADGTTVGRDRTFRTALPPATPPAILGTAPFAPYANSVTLTALLNPGGAQTTYKFQFGTTNAYGAETFAATVPAGVQPVSVRVPLSGLQARTTYHFRTIASNRRGTVVGPDTTFTTGPFPPARLGARTQPTRQRRSHPYFITRGVLRLAEGVSVADGCNGIVGVRFTNGRRTVAHRRMRLASGHCSYRLRMRAVPPRGKSKLRVHVRFYGNAILTPADARTYLVRFR